jgi:hypothetical protein
LIVLTDIAHAVNVESIELRRTHAIVATTTRFRSSAMSVDEHSKAALEKVHTIRQ